MEAYGLIALGLVIAVLVFILIRSKTKGNSSSSIGVKSSLDRKPPRQDQR